MVFARGGETCPGHWISKYGTKLHILCWCGTATRSCPPHCLYLQTRTPPWLHLIAFFRSCEFRVMNIQINSTFAAWLAQLLSYCRLWTVRTLFLVWLPGWNVLHGSTTYSHKIRTSDCWTSRQRGRSSSIWLQYEAVFSCHFRRPLLRSSPSTSRREKIRSKMPATLPDAEAVGQPETRCCDAAAAAAELPPLSIILANACRW